MGERLPAIPGQTIGPFFHVALISDRDRHLVPPGWPGAIRLHGSVYDGSGQPVPDAMLEIRQADGAGDIPAVEGSLLRDGITFTGWGRVSTDPLGRYSFTTIEPGPIGAAPASFFSIIVFARGLLNRQFTRAYVPTDGLDRDQLLSALAPLERERLIAIREADGSLRFDIHLQGEHETIFLTFPGHEPER